MAKQLALLFLALMVTKVQSDADTEVKKLFSDYMEWRFKEHPEYATSTGNNQYNDRIRDTDPARIGPRKTKAEALLKEAQAINSSQISKDSDQVSLAVLKNMLEIFIEGYEWRDFTGLNPVHFMSKEIRDPGHLARAPFNTVGDFENFLARLRAYPERIDNYIQMFMRAYTTNHTYNNASISRVFDQIDAFVNVPPNETDLYKPFTSSLDALTSVQDRNFYRQRGEAAIDAVQTSFLNLKNFLVREYAPRTRSFYGVQGFRRGKEFYAACLRWYLSYNATPEAVHQLGLQEVDRIQDNMRQIMTKQGHEGSIKEYFDMIKTDDRFLMNTGEELLEEYRSIIQDRIRPRLSTVFESVPTTPVLVRPTSTDSSGAYYTRGSLDGSVPSYFNVNVFRPRERPTLPMVALALHEALPGHHQQRMQSMMSDLPIFRQFAESYSSSAVPFALPTYVAFTEGWALYAEYLGEEMEVYKDDYEMMGRYSSEMFRACRLVVDTGLHFYGWDRERAIQYMLNYTSMSRASVEIEVDRYLTIPGQACSYKVGEIKIREARQSAEEKLGDKFDVKKFHALLLNNGAVPLGLLEELVNDWIQSQKPQQYQQPPTPSVTPSVALAHNTGASTFPSSVCMLVLVTAVLAQFCAL